MTTRLLALSVLFLAFPFAAPAQDGSGKASEGEPKKEAEEKKKEAEEEKKKEENPERAKLQELYLDYLAEEGYRPSIDDDGDVRFKAEGKTYFIAVDEDDPEFFRLVFANFWEIESEEERKQALKAAHLATRDCKVGKVFLTEDDTWAAIEIFVADPADFQAVFPRSMRALRAAVDIFVKEMRKTQA